MAHRLHTLAVKSAKVFDIAVVAMIFTALT
jgi:hypothetical protein